MPTGFVGLAVVEFPRRECLLVLAVSTKGWAEEGRLGPARVWGESSENKGRGRGVRSLQEVFYRVRTSQH